MSNFIETFRRGQLGKNFGLTTGIKGLDKAINGLQRKTSIGLGAAAKVGKTKFVDYSFVISPYLQLEELGLLDNIEYIYLSYEIDRVTKEFDYAAFFMFHDHKIFDFEYEGKRYQISGTYLRGAQLHEHPDGTLDPIPVSKEHHELLKIIYEKRIVPLFGEWSDDNIQITPGKIIFIEEPENPTGVNKFLWNYAKQHGKFNEVEYSSMDDHSKPIIRKRITGYTPNNPDKFTIIITDHIRKLRKERGFTMKEVIDKWMEYSVILRNFCWFTFIHVIHNNRALANVDRLRYAGEWVFPTADDSKDSGNPAEDCTIFMTMFNPHDEKYGLKKHMDLTLKEYPNYRSLHITESRNTPCPAHIQVNMFGGVGYFQPINNNQK